MTLQDHIGAYYDRMSEEIRKRGTRMEAGEDEIAESLKDVDAERATALERLDDGGDGVIIARLSVPVTVKGESHERAKIVPMKVKHLRRVFAATDPWALASLLVEPEGLVGELASEADSNLVLVAAEVQRGKYQAAGKS